MSVLVPDLKVYEAVYQKAWSYGFNNTCDINYCSVLKSYNEDHVQQLVKDWLWLNEYSWIRRHDDDGSKPELHEFLSFNHGKKINTYQMLKYLECIRYNIELDTIKTGKTGMEDPVIIPQDKLNSYETLVKAIEEIKSAIINELPEYKQTKWDQI